MGSDSEIPRMNEKMSLPIAGWRREKKEEFYNVRRETLWIKLGY
jgi:hypothetical protein